MPSINAPPLSPTPFIKPHTPPLKSIPAPTVSLVDKDNTPCRKLVSVGDTSDHQRTPVNPNPGNPLKRHRRKSSNTNKTRCKLNMDEHGDHSNQDLENDDDEEEDDEEEDDDEEDEDDLRSETTSPDIECIEEGLEVEQVE